MYLSEIKIQSFKNIESLDCTFSEGTQCIFGENGAGKTNLLDAIYYLGMTKSAFSNGENLTFKFGSDFFRIKGIFSNQGENNEITCAMRQGEKKIVKYGGIEYSKLSAHIGKFPLVLISPDDSEMIDGVSGIRRKFFDTILCQIDSEYMEDLIIYNHILKQRNALLKVFYENNKLDHAQIEPYNKILSEKNTRISTRRITFLNEFLPYFIKSYSFLTSEKEIVNIEYSSKSGFENFELQLQLCLQKDIALQRTTIGIHTDEFDYYSNNNLVKKTGSQGQKKSFLVALKLANFEILYHHKQTKPILLLDDIFDKLDDARIFKLIKLINNQTFGQVFITDARPERSLQLMRTLNQAPTTFMLQNGKLIN
ncbi:MAG: DNA replication and repair protein RecF [Bacteroidota bacterium]|nr:DNA replication and repair protein RecF [Bacteroidota bacterium]